MSFGQLKIEMMDTATNQKVSRTVDNSVGLTSKADAMYRGTKEQQKTAINIWIHERANHQHDTILKLVSWEFVNH